MLVLKAWDRTAFFDLSGNGDHGKRRANVSLNLMSPAMPTIGLHDGSTASGEDHTSAFSLDDKPEIEGDSSGNHITCSTTAWKATETTITNN